jgi:nitroreductase
MNEDFLRVIKTRRVSRDLLDKPVEKAKLEQILDAGRWAPAAGNQRTVRFIVIQDPKTIKLLRIFSPGMFQKPNAIILLTINWDLVRQDKVPDSTKTPFIDLGATMQTMMLATHAIGLGSGAVTSFAKEAIRVILNIPSNITPELMLCIGYAAPPGDKQLPMRRKKRITWETLTHWEGFKD